MRPDIRSPGVPLALAVLLAVAAPVAGQPQPAFEVSGATYLEVDDTSGIWQMRGAPVVVTRGTRAVRAGSMTYDSRQQILSARDGVTVEDAGNEISAMVVTVFLQADQFVAEGNVITVVREQGQETRVRSDHLELWSAERRAVATGTVALTHGEVAVMGDRVEYDLSAQHAVITGQSRITVARGTATAERIEVQLDQEELTATGGVHLLSDDIDGAAPTMVLRNAQQLAILSGGATVRQNRAVLTAEVVMIDLQRRRLTASGQAHFVAYPDR